MNRRVSARSRPKIRKAQLAGPVKAGVKVSNSRNPQGGEDLLGGGLSTAIDGSSP